MESAVKSPPSFVEGGRTDPHCKMDSVHKVDDDNQGGDEVVDVVVP